MIGIQTKKQKEETKANILKALKDNANACSEACNKIDRNGFELKLDKDLTLRVK